MEYRLLALLVERAGEVVPRPILLRLKGTVDVHLCRLRKKTRHILRPAHRNRHLCRLPFPAVSAPELGFEELLHCVGTD